MASVGQGDRHAWATTEAEDLGSGLYRIPLPLPGDALHAVNVYAIVGPDGVDLIDSGMAIVTAREKLTASLARLGLDLGDIRNFFITHIHQDHYTLAVELRTTLAGRISLGEGERVNLAAIRAAQAQRKFPGFIEMLPAMGAADLADKVKAVFTTEFAGPAAALPWEDPDQWLADGMVLDLGRRTLRAIHTPGHTAGHVVFHDEASSLLFAGDHVLPHITPSIGFQPAITRTALADFLTSLQLMLKLPDSRLLPAHGPVSDSTHARVNELLEHHEGRLVQALDGASAGPVTASEVAAAIPWTRRMRKLADLDPMSQILAIGETAAHLEVLVARGQLVRRTAHEGVDTYAIPQMSLRSGGMGLVPVQYTPEQLARLLRLPEPTREQAAVIGAPLGPMAVIAGAGSGKSETMAARVVWLIANGLVRPDRVLGLTFTRRAAAELADRVRSRMDRLRRAGLEGGGTGEAAVADGAPEKGAPDSGAGAWAGDPVIGTYHAYAGRLVSDHALREGIEPTLRLITPAPAWQLAASIVGAYDGPMDQIGWTPQTVTTAVQQLAGDLAEHLRSPSDVVRVGQWLDARYATMPKKTAAARKVVETQRAREQLLPMVRRYLTAKQAREVLDHGDQIALAARIASRHPQVGIIERSRYQVVLLDEYQDTSHAQLVLLLSLFGGGHPVTAVGDPCQSIYGWRGASAGNLLRFAEDFRVKSGDESPVRALSVSFRNSGRVLDVAAVLQSRLRAEAPGVPLLIPAPEAAARGTVSCALLPTVTAEADWVAAQAVALLTLPPGCAPDGKPWPDGRTAGVRPSDIAVLCRKRSQFQDLRRSLAAAGIPFEVVGLGGLLGVPEVQDVVATLRVMHDATASDALARILTGPRWRIGPRDLVALGSRARELATGVLDVDPDAAAEPATAASAVPAADQGPAWADALTEVVTDLTSEGGSLVEALDDLGEPDGYSAGGYARLMALAAEFRWLRQHVSRPLPDLIAEIERTLSLDIEVAARPDGDPGTARADLDKFTDVAATFAGEQSEATLGAFLAYLTAAQQEEFGLETGRVGEADTVKLLTVHAAKGLQWPAVIMPGLAAGEKSQVFPARPRTSTKWTDNCRLIPSTLRGDAADLPQLDDLDADSLNAFNAACTARDVAEERRLAYVAATRAAFWLGCSGYWWGDGTVPLGPSVFLAEVRQACEAGAGTVDEWAGQPAGDAENPLLATVEEADWPTTPAGRSYQAVSSARRLVETAMGTAGGVRSEAPAASLTPAEAELAAAWELDAGLLLAERERRRERGDGPVPVLLPSRLSVSALVTLARDPDELARQVRRPMPQPAARQARRGTEFHQWLEERFGQQRLIGDDDLFADADSPSDVALARLRERFEAGEWGDRWPREVEVPFDTVIGDRQVRGRIDAVFADEDGGFDVVDWKTGQPPRTQAGKDAVAVQLAAYRLAWSALASVPIGRVRAAFYYVRHDLTIRPADLLDEAGLKALVDRVPVRD